MARLAWALLLVATACSASEVSRIVGGDTVSIKEYPSVVQVESWILFSVWSQKCAGNILTASYILSAAQCFTEPLARPGTRRIRAGSNIRNFGGFVSNVAEIHNHPSYGKNGFDGDISVIRLETRLTFSDTIAQASIVAPGSLIPDDLNVVHVGWGSSSFFGDSALYLTKVSVLTVNNAECAKRYLNWPRPPVVTSNMICAGFLDVSAEGTCFGDAGGPLYYDHVVIGIASWGKTCANGTYPDVSTSVGSYTNWIVETVG